MLRTIVFGILLLCACVNGADITILDSQGGSEETVSFKKVDEGEYFAFSLSANGRDIKARNMPQGATLAKNPIDSSFLFQWEPTDVQSGHYSIGFYAGEPNDLTYKSVRIIVSNTKFMITAEKEFSYLFAATDPDNDDVILTMENLPQGATFVGNSVGPKLFTWTPSADQLGVHQMVLTATDNPPDGNAKQDVSTIEITVSLLSAEAMPYDFNRDGKVNGIDFGMFSRYWMKGVPKPKEPEADPEPKVITTTVYKTVGRVYGPVFRSCW